MYPYLFTHNNVEYIALDSESSIVVKDIRSITTSMQYKKNTYIELWFLRIQFKNGADFSWYPAGYQNGRCWEDRKDIVTQTAVDVNRILRSPEELKNLPKGRLGIYQIPISFGSRKYECIFEVEELEQIINQENICMSKVQYLGVTSAQGERHFLSIREQKELLPQMPAWVKTNSISWKKSDEALLTHEVKEIRDRAKAKLEK